MNLSFQQDVLNHFSIKHADVDISSILPMVAGTPLGGYLGATFLGPRLHNPQLGGMLGAIGGGVLGKVLGEVASSPKQQNMSRPPAPTDSFSLDPTNEDIPPWALAGAQLLRPSIEMNKMSAHEGIRDVAGNEMLGSLYPLVDFARGKAPIGDTLKTMAGQTGGLLAGGALGYGLGRALPHIIGSDPKIWNIPLSTILGGLGATIGGVKGLQFARGQ